MKLIVHRALVNPDASLSATWLIHGRGVSIYPWNVNPWYLASEAAAQPLQSLHSFRVSIEGTRVTLSTRVGTRAKLESGN